MEDGLLPHANSRDEREGIEEERRLAYVGMTRARQWLALTGARSRFLFGQRQPTRLSRFLEELPPEAVEDVSEPTYGAAFPRTDDARPRGPRKASTAQLKRRGAPVPSTVTDADGIGWRPGDRVRHRRFGSGVILACQGTGAQLKLVVFFDRAGRKTLVPTIAKLERLS
jgi:DNA helicase-2/ATP-dependent DNA helicase PcrA